MTFKTERADSTFQDEKEEKLYCDLCLDEIDKAFGFYSCGICNMDRCKECANNDKKMDLELAENAVCIATPLIDLKG